MTNDQRLSLWMTLAQLAAGGLLTPIATAGMAAARTTVTEEPPRVALEAIAAGLDLVRWDQELSDLGT